MTWVQRFEIPSQTDPTRTYTVAIKDDGSWGCGCPRWKFARKQLRNGECKHIVIAKSMNEHGERGAAAWSRMSVEQKISIVKEDEDTIPARIQALLNQIAA